MSEAEPHVKGATAALPTSSDLFSVLGGLVNLCIRLSANAASLANASADVCHVRADPTKIASLIYNSVSRLLEFRFTRSLVGTLNLNRVEPLLTCLGPSITSLGRPRYRLVALFLTWWIWRHSVTWILARVTM